MSWKEEVLSEKKLGKTFSLLALDDSQCCKDIRLLDCKNKCMLMLMSFSISNCIKEPLETSTDKANSLIQTKLALGNSLP